MKQINHISLFFLGAVILLVTLTGCPYNSIYKIDNEPQNYTDDTYLGKWKTTIKDKDSIAHDIQLDITRKNDFEYTIVFTGSFYNIKAQCAPNKKDSIFSTAFMSIVGPKQILNIEANGRIYLAEFKYENDQISILPLADHFTSKFIKSNQDLKNAVTFHFKTRLFPLYDDLFCLRNMTRVIDQPI